MLLSEYSQGRNNNFNLIRLLAALTVLLSHCFPLAAGTGDIEPFRHSLGMTVGGIAVDIFFITSGFLVTASLMVRQEAIEFICARALRIYPALWVMLILTALILGGMLTSLPIDDYLESSSVFTYVIRCGIAITGFPNHLPGVFELNPFGSGFNGSLWTLQYELGMYGILLLLWLLLSFLPLNRLFAFKWGILVFCVLSGSYLLIGYFRHGLPTHFELHSTYTFQSLFFMFFAGSAFYVLRYRIVLSRRLFWILLALLLISSLDRHGFYVAYLLTLPYLLFYLAFVPAGWYRGFNKLGDYSYGTYIYAFPVQQTVVATLAGISILELALISVPATLILAALSWHLIEKRVLNFKSDFSQILRQRFGINTQNT